MADPRLTELIFRLKQAAGTLSAETSKLTEALERVNQPGDDIAKTSKQVYIDLLNQRIEELKALGEYIRLKDEALEYLGSRVNAEAHEPGGKK
jgi:ABC-type transporter Mla subunit MlaD